MDPVPGLWLAACALISTILSKCGPRCTSETSGRSVVRGSPPFVLPCACRAKFAPPQRIFRAGMELRSLARKSERMGFISEIRHPTTWYTKLAIVILALFLFLLLAAGATAGYLIYRMTSPSVGHSEINLGNFRTSREA